MAERNHGEAIEEGSTRRRDAVTLAQIMGWEDDGEPRRLVHDAWTLACPVFLIGFMGAGKTTVARRIARKLGIASVDMDNFIERREGKKIRRIFDECGESAFRDMETAVLRELIALEPLLISCGGGVIEREENRRALKESGFVIYLAVSTEEAADRIGRLSLRPMFQDMDVARSTNEERAPLYAEAADACIDTAGKPLWEIANEVRKILVKEEILCQMPAS